MYAVSTHKYAPYSGIGARKHALAVHGSAGSARNNLMPRKALCVCVCACFVWNERRHGAGQKETSEIANNTHKLSLHAALGQERRANMGERASPCPRAMNGAGYAHRHTTRAAPRVLRRALVQGFRLRHLLVGAAGLRPGVGRAGDRDASRSGQARDGARDWVRDCASTAPEQHRAPAGLGARASAAFVGSEANELCEQEMGKLHRRAPQGVSAGDGLHIAPR